MTTPNSASQSQSADSVPENAETGSESQKPNTETTPAPTPTPAPAPLLPAPIEAMNEWSCTLASVSWFMTRLGSPISQQEMVYRFGLYFPEWFHRVGLTDRGDVVNLFSRLGVQFRKFMHLNDKDELLEVLKKYGGGLYAGFIFTRKPTNHCLAVHSWSGDFVVVMNSEPKNARFLTIKWDDVFGPLDSDAMFFFV